MDKPLVLVVDDEADHRSLLTIILRRTCEVVGAADAAEALEICAQREPELAIVDQRMPGMSGLELLTELRQRHPDCVRVLLTAFTDTDLLQRAINQAEVYRFIAKPWDPELLRVDVQRALEHRASELDLRRSQKLAVLGGLAGAVAHDLRGLLTPVVLAPRLLRGGDATPEEVAALLDRTGETMRGLVDELLTLAKGETPRLQRRPSRLDQLVTGALSLLRGSELDSVVVDLQLEELPEFEFADDRVTRMLVNLLRNAALSGGRRIVVTTDRLPGGQTLAVGDDGPGVPEALRERIFDPLFSTRGEAGHGLGLSICRTVAEAHGGTLVCSESPLGGALFVATFMRASA